MTRTISVTTPDLPRGARILVPIGIETPHDCVHRCEISGGTVSQTTAAVGLNLHAALVTAEGGPIGIRYTSGEGNGCAYPQDAFRPRVTVYTTAADELTGRAQELVAGAANEHEAVQHLVDEAHGLFTYGHPEERFTDGHTHVPLVSCGGAEGSCVDINTYLVAMARAVGLKAAYLYGYFFPLERGGEARDMHCWVATEADGLVEEWDIAHHLKANLSPVRAALDPKPGVRVALGHSMGHRYMIDGDPVETKLLGEPMRLDKGRLTPMEGLSIRTSPWPPEGLAVRPAA